MKRKLLSKEGIKPKDFANKRSYEATLWVIDMLNNIITHTNKGWLLLNYENLIKPDFEIRWREPGVFDCIIIRDSECCITCIVGSTCTDLDGVWKPWLTKREMREYFKLWRLVEPKHATRVIDFTK